MILFAVDTVSTIPGIPAQYNGLVEIVKLVLALGTAILAWWAKASSQDNKEKIAEVHEKVKDVEGLVNGPMSHALKAVSDLSAFKAETTGKAVDIIAATAADKALAEHRATLPNPVLPDQ